MSGDTERRALDNYEAIVTAIDTKDAQISSLQKQLSDCKSSLRAAEAEVERLAGLESESAEATEIVTEWRSRAETAAAERDFEQSSRLTSEAQLGTQIDNLLRERRAAESREKQLRAALEHTLEFLDEIGSTTPEQWGRLNPRLISGFARAIAKSARDLASKEGGT